MWVWGCICMNYAHTRFLFLVPCHSARHLWGVRVGFSLPRSFGFVESGQVGVESVNVSHGAWGQI